MASQPESFSISLAELSHILLGERAKLFKDKNSVCLKGPQWLAVSRLASRNLFQLA